MAFDRKKLQLDLTKQSLSHAFRELTLARLTLRCPSLDKISADLVAEIEKLDPEEAATLRNWETR